MRDLGNFFRVGDAWLAVLRLIASDGAIVNNDNEIYRELKGITFSTGCDYPDFILDRYARSENIIWMEKNFTSFNTISELNSARSYASRLFAYNGAKDQLEWVAKKITANHNTRSATITMLEPLTDKSYIPCISMLDFDVSDERLNVYVYARALDFGKKAYANMLSIWNILKNLSAYANLEIGKMIWICKSVHYYADDFKQVEKMLGELDEYKPCAI